MEKRQVACVSEQRVPEHNDSSARHARPCGNAPAGDSTQPTNLGRLGRGRTRYIGRYVGRTVLFLCEKIYMHFISVVMFILYIVTWAPMYFLRACTRS